MSETVAVVDYGMGNLHSVEFAFLRLSQPCLKEKTIKKK